MNRKIVSGLVLSTLLVSMFALASSTESVNTWENGTIYIRADGSISPPDAPISTNDKVVYTLTDDIVSDADGIVVERNNIIVDGAGYTLEGGGSGTGVLVREPYFDGYMDLVTIRNMTIRTFNTGIYLKTCQRGVISENNITITIDYCIQLDECLTTTISENSITVNHRTSIYLHKSSWNNISENRIDSSHNGLYGIDVEHSNRNRITGNIVTNNEWGISVTYGDYNVLSGNTITNNTSGIRLFDASNNTVSGNTVKYNVWGIGASVYSHDNVFSGNTVTNNLWSSITIGGGGHLSSNNIVSNNIVANTYDGDGIWLMEDSDSNTVSGNTVTNNNGHGIFVGQYSPNNTVSGNTVTNNNDNGIRVQYSPNNTICGNIVTNNTGRYAIFIWNSSNSIVSENTVMNNDYGICFSDSSNNIVSGNTATHNNVGIGFWNSTNNDVTAGNNVAYNNMGILFRENSSESYIYHNNFVDNWVQSEQNGLNSWDNGPLDGGNYWSDYEGIDTDSDGIGDTETPHHKDRYPFIIPLGPIPVYHEETRYDCTINGSCMTVSRFSMDEDKTLSFNIAGEGYINLTIPRKLLDGQFKVVIDNDPHPSILWWNDTYTSICFTYDEEGIHNVKVIADISTKTPSESPDISMKFNVGPSFSGNYNLTVPRTLLDGQFKITVNDVTVPSILSWNKTHTSIYFAYSEEDLHNVRIIAKNSIIRFPDINADRTINILDIAAVAIHFGETLDP